MKSAAIKEASAGRWMDLLVDLGGLSPDLLDGHHHPCPRCGGTDRFRLIDQAAGAVLCNQCFREKNGDGFAALQWLRGWSFKEALAAVAERLGLNGGPGGATGAGGGARRRAPEDALEWYGWNPGIVHGWLRHKPGLIPEALEANGAQVARWRGRFTVIALPILGPGLAPTGWVLWNSTGEPLPRGAGLEAKMLVTRGSKAGWIGRYALELARWEAAETIWKVEGPTDLLALWAAIPEDLRGRHLVVTNAFGAGEKPRPGLLHVFKGKRVNVVGDLDLVGQEGARRWADAAAKVAISVQTVRLPAMEGGGKDLRDWLARGHGFHDLLALVEAQDAASAADSAKSEHDPAPAADSAASGDLVEEADDDPSRLALAFMKLRPGRVATYLDEVYYWQDGRWVLTEGGNLRSDLICFLRKELHRCNFEELAAAMNTEGPPPKAKKVTTGLAANVLQALKAFTTISAEVRLSSEVALQDSESLGRVISGEPRQWIACENGILEMDTLLRGDREVLRPHAPTWWSPHKLPYAFDPKAGPAERPRWEAFLERNLEGDSDRIAVLQEWAGYCLVPDTSLQRFLILEGEGANGKSVYCALLEALLGVDNVSHVPLELFAQRFALTPTLGRLANVTTEVGELDKVAEGYVKAFVAGDPMQFDRKLKDPIECRPTARLVIATNNRPRFSDRSQGIWRRLLLVPFHVEIPAGERVRGMDNPSWWLRSGEMPAILNWAIEGLGRLQEMSRFTESASSAEAIEDYKEESNPARQFLRENYQELEGAEVQTDKVYETYTEWCEKNGHRPLGSRMFGREVFRVFPHVNRAHRGNSRGPGRSRVYSGLWMRIQGEFDFKGGAP